jgi:hypothetical protein
MNQFSTVYTIGARCDLIANSSPALTRQFKHDLESPDSKGPSSHPEEVQKSCSSEIERFGFRVCAKTFILAGEVRLRLKTKKICHNGSSPVSFCIPEPKSLRDFLSYPVFVAGTAIFSLRYCHRLWAIGELLFHDKWNSQSTT